MNPPATTFHVTGGTLHHDAPSYVEREADRELYEGLTRGEFCYVLTARQMGKSSLMVRTAARLRQAGVAVAILDLTAIGQNLSVEQWYDGLLGLMGPQLGLALFHGRVLRGHPGVLQPADGGRGVRPAEFLFVGGGGAHRFDPGHADDAVQHWAPDRAE